MNEISISEKWKRSNRPIMMTIMVGLLLFFLSLVPATLNLDFKWVQPEIHASLEGIAGIMCVILSFSLINKTFSKSNHPILLLLASVFFIIGIGDILHSFQKPSNLFIFYHSFSGFFGGIISLLIFFPRLLVWISDRKFANTTIVSSILLIYLLFMVFPDMIPYMGSDHEFSNYSIILNSVAGGAFLLLTIKLLSLQMAQKIDFDYTNYSLIFIIFSVSHLTFYESALWDISWWIWHFYSFFAIGVVIYSVISSQKKLIIRINNANILLSETKESLLFSNHVLETKNKELEQFTYITSHDLQEPLNSILAFSSLLKQNTGSKLDKLGLQSISIIEESSIRMKEFITSLLEYSRIGREKEKTNVNIPELIKDLENDLHDLIEREDVTMKYIGDNLTISAYKTDLTKLFQNIIVNGIKYKKDDERPFIVINSRELPDEYEFSVTDNGIGIEKEHFDKIFEVFRRLHTSDKYQGTGIGLAYCKKIVELHKGKIWLESTPGKGSKFYFSISKT